MNNLNISKLESLVNFCNNKLYKRAVIILVGKLGLYISALKHNRVKQSIFIKYTNKNSKTLYQNFFKKYKKWHITFLIDHNNCRLKHEMLPVVTSIIEGNPVESFIDENYEADTIVAYNIYEITHQNGEIWNSCIASIAFSPPISELLEYVLSNSLKYSGSYFLSLETSSIIEKLLQETPFTDCCNNLQIFITITQSSGIKLIAKYKQNIMHDETIDYPPGKSDMYIQGTIEQTISDQLIFYKDYIKKLKLKVSIILLVDDALQKLLSDLKFDNCTIVALNQHKSLGKKRGRFQDDILIQNFNRSNTHLALNKSLKSLTQLSFVNSLIFKPLIILALVLIATLANIKFKSFSIREKTSQLNQKYYALSEEYRNIQKRYPNIKNINDLIDLHNLENIINTPAITPFADLKNLFTVTNHPRLEISNIKWNIIVLTVLISSKFKPFYNINQNFKFHKSIAHV